MREALDALWQGAAVSRRGEGSLLEVGLGTRADHVGSQAQSPAVHLLRNGDAAVGSGKVITVPGSVLRPLAERGTAQASNKRVNLTRRGADVLISNRRTRKLRAMR